jgi:CDP-diacylglycerol---glycerol-3-phosphate 3-phosphatidyltransferase
MVATLYFGWHYVVDDIAGLGIGVIAVLLAGVATGHLRLAVPVAWRPAVPNVLTLGRIAIIPAVVWLLLESGGLSLTAAGLFAAASLTDACDGHLARRWKVESVFGTLADPFADKLLVLGSLVALASAGRVPVWVVAVIAAREVWVTLLRMHARRSGVVIAAGPLGKAKMVVQVFTVLALMALDLSGAALYVPLYAMVAITIASGIEIALRARRRTTPVPARARAIAGAS